MSGKEAQRIGAGAKGMMPALPNRDRINRRDPRLRWQRPRTLPGSAEPAIPAGHLASRREAPRRPAPEAAAGVPLVSRPPIPEPAAGLPLGARPEAAGRAGR